jgi:prepilin signal peptidase PulO-like enzyme (type II secretory pathway)
MKANIAENAFVWSLEKVVNGERKTTILPQKDFEFSNFKDEQIWVTPKIPFLVLLTIGYGFSFILGDVLYKMISFFL